MKKTIYYWSPCLDKVGTVKSTLNSAIAVAFSLIPILMAIMYYKKSNPALKSQNYDSSPYS